MSKYIFDAERFCKNNKGRIGELPDGSDPMEHLEAELKRLREIIESPWKCSVCGNYVTNEDANK